jgi:5-methylcytosine-specific restriction endonuclease McrBC regulatory subunit McrC
VHLRLCEWARINHTLPSEVCQEIDSAVDAWRIINRLSRPPVSFAGPGGRQLCSSQYVGIVEVGDVAIEIYPKLDASLIEVGQQPLDDAMPTNTVMRNLLWMLEVASHRDLAEAATGHLEEVPTSFFDLFAYLLGKNLLPELERGIPHSYLKFADDIRAIRGRIGLVEQITRNWNRFDRVFCSWDEFTPNTAINRLLKCACGFLAERVKYGEAARLLTDCQTLLTEVEDVSVTNALREVQNVRFDRSVQRFKTAFDLAKRLMTGVGHNLGVGSAHTFVFLLNMNEVFESYVHAVLEAYFKTAVSEQEFVGTLLSIRPGGILQFADYYWQLDSCRWIGDAKYKHMTKGQQRSLRFIDFGTEEESEAFLAGHVLSPTDVRQLTVYAELVRRGMRLETPPNLMLLYPFVGTAEQCLSDSVNAWNGSEFWLMPVRVSPMDVLSDAIPPLDKKTLAIC